MAPWGAPPFPQQRRHTAPHLNFPSSALGLNGPVLRAFITSLFKKSGLGTKIVPMMELPNGTKLVLFNFGKWLAKTPNRAVHFPIKHTRAVILKMANSGKTVIH